MAKLNGNFDFTGPLGNVSVYKRHDIAQPIMRTKGGASKEQIKTAPRFANTRRINAEFGGRSTASRAVMRAIWHLKPLGDYNIAGPVNALLKHVQGMDTVSAYGQRHVQLTKNPYLLQGFSLNQKRLFDSLIRNEVSYQLSRDEQRAEVQVPALLPAINFFPQVNYPLFSLVVTLGIISDQFYAAWGYEPSPGIERNMGASTVVYSDWLPVLKGAPAQTIAIEYPVRLAGENHSLVLGIGIRFGMLLESGEVGQVAHAGSAKVLAVV